MAGSILPLENLPSGVEIVTESLPQDELDAISYLNAVDTVVHEAAEHWPDDSLDAPESRRFRLLYNGSTIFSRSTQLERRDRAKLNKFAGAIVELDSNEKPMYFADADALDAAWKELQESFATLSEEAD